MTIDELIQRLEDYRDAIDGDAILLIIVGIIWWAMASSI